MKVKCKGFVGEIVWDADLDPPCFRISALHEESGATLECQHERLLGGDGCIFSEFYKLVDATYAALDEEHSND